MMSTFLLSHAAANSHIEFHSSLILNLINPIWFYFETFSAPLVAVLEARLKLENKIENFCNFFFIVKFYWFFSIQYFIFFLFAVINFSSQNSFFMTFYHNYHHPQLAIFFTLFMSDHYKLAYWLMNANQWGLMIWL